MTCELDLSGGGRSRRLSRIARRASAVPLAMGALLAGCSRGLEPVEFANSKVTDTASTTVAGVAVVAKTGWSGESRVDTFVTPVHIEIENGNPQPLRVRYSNMSLQSHEAQTLRALPPFDVRRLVRARTKHIIAKFGYRDAAVAPYLESVYEGVEVEPPLANLEYPYDYAELYDRWQASPRLPTQYMQEVALPEARVRPQGELSGFVYFEPVTPSDERVTLNVALQDADSGECLGVARLPLVIR